MSTVVSDNYTMALQLVPNSYITEVPAEVAGGTVTFPQPVTSIRFSGEMVADYMEADVKFKLVFIDAAGNTLSSQVVDYTEALYTYKPQVDAVCDGPAVKVRVYMVADTMPTNYGGRWAFITDSAITGEAYVAPEAECKCSQLEDALAQLSTAFNAFKSEVERISSSLPA